MLPIGRPWGCVPALMLVLLLRFPPGAWSGELLVTQDGTPRAAVVLLAPRSERIDAAVADLRGYIEHMSGAAVELRSEPSPSLGNLFLTLESDGSAVPDRADLATLNQEGFILRVRGQEAWLCGRTELGLQHGVYWLLEQWGCRWLFPGEAGEVVPESPTLRISQEMETEQQPFFLMRDLWYNWGSWLPERMQKDHAEWVRRNRLEFSLTGYIGHVYHSIVPHGDDALFRDHPEYYPMVHGERVRRGQMCTGNPGVRARAVAYAMDYFRRNPADAMVSMSPNDGGGPWRCPENQGYRSFSDAALDLANHVARALRENPGTRDKLAAMYAYYDTARPPTLQAEKNVIVFLATRFNPVPWACLLRRWSEKSTLLGIRDYASILPLMWNQPTWGLGRLERAVRRWAAYKVQAVSVETGDDWGGWGLYHYILARKLWDPEAEIDAVFDDYLSRGFGAAAPVMRRYFAIWKWGYSPNTLARAMRIVHAALEVETTPEIRKRIEDFALYLHHLRLMDDRRFARGPEARRRAIEKLVGFGWRVAPTHMAHTFPLIERYLREEAVETLGVSAERYESWKSDEPFDSAEIRRLLDQDLKDAARRSSGGTTGKRP